MAIFVSLNIPDLQGININATTYSLQLTQAVAIITDILYRFHLYPCTR